MKTRFDWFAERVEALFGISAYQAADLLDTLEEQDFPLGPRGGPIAAWAPDILDVLAESGALAVEGYDDDEYSPYVLDPYFPDDDWLEAEEEWELTVDYPVR